VVPQLEGLISSIALSTAKLWAEATSHVSDFPIDQAVRREGVGLELQARICGMQISPSYE